MSDQSIFMEKGIVPTDNDLIENLGSSFQLWKDIESVVLGLYPEGKGEWNFPGKNYGWSYRIKDKKRALIYLLPRSGFFRVAFVSGQKAYDIIMKENISASIKDDLSKAKKFAEGRGVRITVEDKKILPDITKLIRIKIGN